MSGTNRYDAGVKRWVADTYGLALHQIARVAFDVQEVALSVETDPELQLEIDVCMTDDSRHHFTRGAHDLGAIVDEVVVVAH